MARKKIIDTGIRYQSWDEVDAALKELCVHEREAALISGGAERADRHGEGKCGRAT